MGLGMASWLARAGFVVTGFDIDPEAMARLVIEGGQVAETARVAARSADVFIIVVATSAQTSKILFDDDEGALESLPLDSVILLCITATPEYVSEIQDRLKAANRSDIRLVDCPISGGEVRAWKGTLSLLCAGDKEDIDRIHSLLLSKLSSALDTWRYWGRNECEDGSPDPRWSAHLGQCRGDGSDSRCRTRSTIDL